MSFNETHVSVISARAPETIFPEVTTLTDLKKAVRRLAAILHPDANPHSVSDADVAFKRLTVWAERAGQKIKSGSWGDGKPTAEFKFRTKVGDYGVFGLSRREALFDSLDASVNDVPVLLHVARLTRYELLAALAAKALRPLGGVGCPTVVEVIKLNGRSAYVTDPIPEGFVTLASIMASYPRGLPLLMLLHYTQSMLGLVARLATQGLVHGSINPITWWVHPTTTASYLTDWHYSVRRGEVVEYQNGTYAGLCPWEVRAMKATDAGTDLAAVMLVMQEALGVSDAPRELFNIISEHLREGRARPTDPAKCQWKIQAILQTTDL